jgi:hypothetical protein
MLPVFSTDVYPRGSRFLNQGETKKGSLCRFAAAGLASRCTR